MSAVAYAVVMADGWYVGIYKDRATAEIVANKHPKGEVRAMVLAPRQEESAPHHELCDAAFKHSMTATHQLAALESERQALRTVLDLCMEELPDCAAYGDLPGYIAGLRAQPDPLSQALNEGDGSYRP